jgi:threonine dehydrogenase-like Zn-dependent dehydrogenase
VRHRRRVLHRTDGLPAAGPGGSALRSVWAAALRPGERVLICGPGTIGLLAAMFALAHGAQVHVLGLDRRSLGFAAGLGVRGAQYAAGSVDPRPLVAATVGLGEVGDVLAGWRPADSGPGPKVHVDPRA